MNYYWTPPLVELGRTDSNYFLARRLNRSNQSSRSSEAARDKSGRATLKVCQYIHAPRPLSLAFHYPAHLQRYRIRQLDGDTQYNLEDADERDGLEHEVLVAIETRD